jgi:ubiquinone/menaquinone biosynthesis C-methylase UbiE
MKRSARDFDTISREVFAPIYPVIAERLLSWSGVREGICLDIGSGTGMLAIALAERSDLSILAMDLDYEMAEIATRRFSEASLSGRITPLLGDVHRMPLRDESVNLTVSRGSLYFWSDRPRAFAEVERVLAAGGIAYLGGSFGTAILRDAIFLEMRRRNPHWDEDVARRSSTATEEQLLAELEKSGVELFRIIKEEAGMWVEIRRL